MRCQPQGTAADRTSDVVIAERLDGLIDGHSNIRPVLDKGTAAEPGSGVSINQSRPVMTDQAVDEVGRGRGPTRHVNTGGGKLDRGVVESDVTIGFHHDTSGTVLNRRARKHSGNKTGCGCDSHAPRAVEYVSVQDIYVAARGRHTHLDPGALTDARRGEVKDLATLDIEDASQNKPDAVNSRRRRCSSINRKVTERDDGPGAVDNNTVRTGSQDRAEAAAMGAVDRHRLGDGHGPETTWIEAVNLAAGSGL